MPNERPPLETLLYEGKLPLEGACWNCGFFCRKDEHNRHLSSFTAISTDDRAWGRFYPFMDVWAPWCFRWVPIMSEISAKLGHEPVVLIGNDEVQKAQNAAAMEVAIRDRKCPKWVKFKPGLSPKEHADEVFVVELEELRRQNDLKIAELQRKSQEDSIAVVKSLEQIQKDHLEFVRISNRQTGKFNLAFLVLAFIAAILAIGALAYPNGATWLDWMPGQRSAQIQQSTADATTPTPQPAS